MKFKHFGALTVYLLCAGCASITKAQDPEPAEADAGTKTKMVVESLDGPVTRKEIEAFKSYIQTIQAPPRGDHNIWVFGNPGRAIEACGSMYEATHDAEILDRMIYFADAALATRDDLASAASGGQVKLWTGQIEPVWPVSPGTPPEAGAGAAIEQGEVVSRIAYCARMILESPELAAKKVPLGDPNSFGATYKERALTYIKQGDHVMDAWILPRFIRTAENNHYYFPAGNNAYKPGEAAPWNQAWMLTRGFIRLTQCHVLLKDDAARVARYDAIVKPNIDWFFASTRPNKSPVGSECRLWNYVISAPAIEDTNHAAYDIGGLWIAYDSGRYGITKAQLVPFANTYLDIVLATVKDGKFAGRVDGTTGTGNRGGDKYVRHEYLYLAEIRPDAYERMGKIELETGQTASSLPVTARLLWLKNRRDVAAKAVAKTDKP